MEINRHTFPETLDEVSFDEVGHPMLPRKTSRKAQARPYRKPTQVGG